MMSRKHTKMNLDFDIKFSDIDDSDCDSGFAKANVLICYTGKNRNKTIILEDAITNACKTLKNIPIVGHYDSDENEFGGHDLGVKKDDKNNIILYNETTPFGVIPESAKIWYEDEVVDGETKKCLFAEAILWKRQYGFEHIKESGSLAQSMEIDVYDYEKKDDGYLQINDFAFTALCILERDEPCFENASVNLYSYDGNDLIAESFKKQFSIMIDNFMNEVQKEGEKVEKNKEKLDNKLEFGKTKEDNEKGKENENHVNDDSLMLKKKEVEGKFALASEKRNNISKALTDHSVFDTNGRELGYVYLYMLDYDEKYAYFNEHFYAYADGQEDYECKKRAKYTIGKDGTASIDFDGSEEVSMRYLTSDEIGLIEANARAEALKEFEAYKNKYPSDKFTELEQYKLDNEKRIKSEKADEIISKYSESLSGSSEFDELVKNKANYSLEDLDKECLVLVGKFALINKKEESKDKKDEKPIKFSVIDDGKEKDSQYGGILKHF